MNLQKLDNAKETSANNPPKVLFVEPFYGGSHKQLIDLLMKNVPSHTFVSLTPKKWHWRARCSPLVLASTIPTVTSETVLFCSSVLNLPELVGLRPDLQPLKKLVYFHENQLTYPVQTIKKRDVQFAYNQIVTCLAADVVLFNSNFNRNSFLDNVRKIMKLLPDYRPKDLRTQIERKCDVLYFPVQLPKIASRVKPPKLHVVWAHRWEFDKGPEMFFDVLFRLKAAGAEFSVSILGETFADVPDVFGKAGEVLKNEISHFGYLESKEAYYGVLAASHVAVSTAKHEFFGVSMLEAVHLKCYPLVPNALVYPEIYPQECLYDNEDELYKRLKHFCGKPDEAVVLRENMKIDLGRFSADNLLPSYTKLFE